METVVENLIFLFLVGFSFRLLLVLVFEMKYCICTYDFS